MLVLLVKCSILIQEIQKSKTNKIGNTNFHIGRNIILVINAINYLKYNILYRHLIN